MCTLFIKAPKGTTLFFDKTNSSYEGIRVDHGLLSPTALIKILNIEKSIQGTQNGYQNTCQ